MQKTKKIWLSVWLLSFFSAFFVCILLRSFTYSGIFILAGIIIAVVAQIVFGSATWASAPAAGGYSRHAHVAMISPTIMNETAKERYMQKEKESEWSIGFGITITGFLLFLGGILASFCITYLIPR